MKRDIARKFKWKIVKLCNKGTEKVGWLWEQYERGLIKRQKSQKSWNCVEFDN
jgi:hypothetical protein